ncbi:hypothetical protein ACFQFC_26250 [Amorphoplanes digitatis]|uniref:Flagellar biosynthesis protein FlhF n=1 Tax=Actinoplanes digitatis TaxID=1868 RepID=A0A7W7HSB1_9ACTN|nr:hypothetical protein [Actinoplanes digitatis]MBB4759641.1 hypothetical protein [Actinoplanes digitatis]GID96865.1 hypothetical protein Adi01nite_62770 [Actinoplanes digitatis]
MPTRVLLEGPAIEPLLAQVRDEYGSSVRIISADKVRTGGFGGFFAKQRYELSVEVPDADERGEPPPSRPAPAEEPQSLEQLLAQAESGDRIAPDDDRRTGRDAGMGDAASAVGRPVREGGREVTDPGAAFAELMAGLDKAEDPAWSRPRPHAAQAEQPDDGPTVRPFRPAKATGSPVNGGATGGVRPLPPVPSLAELMGGLNVSGDPAAAAAAGRPGPNPVSRTAAAAYGLAPVPAATTAADLAETLAGLGLGGPGTTPQPPAMLRPMHPDPVQRNLMMVGMPEEMVAQIVGGDTYSGVLGVLASRPAAPGVPDAPGEILVLCGDLDHALPLGRKLCEQAGIDQAHLLLGGPTAAGTGLHSSKVLGDPPAAATRAERLQNADHAWIVVVDAKVGGTDPIWVSDMCEALGATAVWAVVDATRKTTDTARHLRMLGDVEALVVHSLDLTSDPATVLGLERPVVSLDGKPATPHAWAAMLCARIASDVVPMPALPRRPARGR